MAVLFLSTGARIAAERGRSTFDFQSSPLLLAAGRLRLRLPGDRFPAPGDQIQDALVVFEPRLLGQVRVTLNNGPAQAGRARKRHGHPPGQPVETTRKEVCDGGAVLHRRR
jgi:hypothetical protein